MQQKNLVISINGSMRKIASIIYEYRFITALAFASLLLFSNCKKLAAASGDRGALEELFEENFLNKNFVVHFASDSSTDITGQYNGYNFILTKTTSFYEGPMTGTKAGVTYSGTWKSNDDYSRLDILLSSPAIPTELNFINRAWRFTKKAVPIMELAPWGTTGPQVLHMKRL